MKKARSARKVRPRQPRNPWVTARKLVQTGALLGFVILFIAARSSAWPASLLNLAMRLDPLLTLANLLASRIFLAASALALLSLLLALIFGRAWCGWLCPLGTLLDWFSLKGWRARRLGARAADPNAGAPPEGWRMLKYLLLFTILAAALLGNLTLLVFDPLTLLYRTLAVSLWPALDQVVSAIEMQLYRLPFLAGPLSAIDAWLRPRLLPLEPVSYPAAWFFGLLFLGLLTLNVWAPRFWCRYLCPLGGLFGLFGKVAFFRRQVGEECKGCKLCASACPTGTIDPQQGYRSDPSECTLCLDCLQACPRSLIAFNPGLKPAAWKAYDPGRREALLSIGAAVLGVALLRAGDEQRPASARLLRPPGALAVNPDPLALTRCVRCAACVRTCPTGALQSAVFEAGPQGFGTPVFIPRLGYCDYSCNACGQICPVQAIPPLPLAEKRQAVIGKAVLDRNRCIPWSQERPCIICEEMCPLPEKAIQLETLQVPGPNGALIELQRPHVIYERCIGCGICETRCPLVGAAAIQVLPA